MIDKLKKMFLVAFAMGVTTSLHAQIPFTCPVNNTVTLTCQNVGMEALWVRLGNDMNTIASLNPSTADPVLAQTYFNDGVDTYSRISATLSPNNLNLQAAFSDWWADYYKFYQNPNTTTGEAYVSKANALIAVLKATYSSFLPSSQIIRFNTTIELYLTTLTINSIIAVYSLSAPGLYVEGVNSSAAVLRDTAFIGVFLDKSLSGTVPG